MTLEVVWSGTLERAGKCSTLLPSIDGWNSSLPTVETVGRAIQYQWELTNKIVGRAEQMAIYRDYSEKGLCVTKLVPKYHRGKRTIRTVIAMHSRRASRGFSRT